MTQRRDVIRSKQAIINAYYELLLQKHSPKITVKEILEQANVSRGTFYAHFRDIADLEEQFEDFIIGKVNHVLQSAPLDKLIEAPYAQLDMLLNNLLNHKEQLQLFITIHDPKIIGKLKNIFIETLNDACETYIKKEHADILNSCICGCIFDAFIMWIISDDPLPREEFLQLVSDFLSGGLQKTFVQT